MERVGVIIIVNTRIEEGILVCTGHGYTVILDIGNFLMLTTSLSTKLSFLDNGPMT